MEQLFTLLLTLPEVCSRNQASFVHPVLREPLSLQIQTEQSLSSDSVTSVTCTVNLTCLLTAPFKETQSLCPSPAAAGSEGAVCYIASLS